MGSFTISSRERLGWSIGKHASLLHSHRLTWKTRVLWLNWYKLLGPDTVTDMLSTATGKAMSWVLICGSHIFKLEKAKARKLTTELG